ncbi:MAG TPA: hypothetical protein VEJ18_06345 [Planctomycetota bacterium]|nr:hypothetical protein [Planctomycetota bacterium]
MVYVHGVEVLLSEIAEASSRSMAQIAAAIDAGRLPWTWATPVEPLPLPATPDVSLAADLAISEDVAEFARKRLLSPGWSVPGHTEGE